MSEVASGKIGSSRCEMGKILAGMFLSSKIESSDFAVFWELVKLGYFKAVPGKKIMCLHSFSRYGTIFVE